MIDPENLTDYGRTRAALEELTLFATMAPTKPAARMAVILETMFTNARLVYGDELTPFDIVRLWIEHGVLGQVLRRYHVGQYARLERCWRELVRMEEVTSSGAGQERYVRLVRQVDLRNLSQLEAIHGIGPKTARLIVLHSVKGVRAIPIDTHWIKELRLRGYPIQITIKDGVTVVPMNARSHAVYEQYALAEVDKSRLTAAEYDLMIWRKWNQAAQRKAA